MKRLSLALLLILSFSMPAKAAVTLEEIESIISKIEQNQNLTKKEQNDVKRLIGKHANFFTASANKKLVKIANLGKLSQNQTGSPTQRQKVVAELKEFVADKKHIEIFETKLKNADYSDLENLVSDYLLHLEKEVGIACKRNYFGPLYAELDIAIRYGIPEIIERIINLNQLKITEGLLQKLEKAQDKAYDCPWFNSGADFERCKELLEATVLKNT